MDGRLCSEHHGFAGRVMDRFTNSEWMSLDEAGARGNDREVGMNPEGIDNKQGKQRGREFYSTQDGRFDLFSSGVSNGWLCLDADRGRIYRLPKLADGLLKVERILAEEQDDRQR